MSTEDKETPFQPDKDEGISLEQLLAGVTSENLHPEVDTGKPVGKEAEEL